MERKQTGFLNPSEDWRDIAINDALTALAYDGEGTDIIIREMRRNRPGCSTLMLNPDRVQLMRFLMEETKNFRPLLDGANIHLEHDEVCPYTGWFMVTWNGMELEVAVTPSTYVSAFTIIMSMSDDVEKLHAFGKALEEYTQRPKGRCLRYASYWESAPDMDAELGKVTWDDIVLAPKVLQGVREAIEGFVHHKAAFDTLGFPWRRGILLIGPPGTGKTMICKAAAAALPSMPFLYVRDFTSDHHRDAIEVIFERARELAPCLLAFEDIDGMVTAANRTVFLNELDGFRNNDGILIIASSNHPGRIDEALLKRPSRFDRVFHIGLPGNQERQAYCMNLLSRSSIAERLSPEVDLEALARSVADWSDGFTPAYIKEVFISAALKRAQAGAEVLDMEFYNVVLAQVEELRKHLNMVKNPDALADFISPETSPVGVRRNR